MKVINVNLHKGHPILERSPTLKQYAQFIDRVRSHIKLDRMNRDEAILMSIESCVKEGILEDFLRKHGSEVINMLTGITLEELYEIREEEAEERGAKKAAEEKDRKFVTKLLRENWAIDRIQELTEVSKERILEIKAAIGA